MKCHACGQENDDKGLFCIACRRPLVAPSPPPTRLQPLEQPRGPALAGAAAAAGAASGTWGAGPAGPSGDARPLHARYTPPGAPVDAEGTGLVDEEACWRAVIGDTNTGYYLTRFGRLARGDTASWHWPGALLTFYWLLYRKMWGWALAYFLMPFVMAFPVGLLAALVPGASGLVVFAWWAALFIVPGIYANRLYYAHARKVMQRVRAQGGSREQQLARLEARGGTSNIVLIIVAVLGVFAGIGMLAAIALPAYQTYTIKAKVSEAVIEGAQVTQAIGREYERTGSLPADVDRLVAEVPHPSRYVQAVRLDPATGVLSVDVEVPPAVQGTLSFVPAVDGGRRLTWSCATDGLQRYVPAACRHAAGS